MFGQSAVLCEFSGFLFWRARLFNFSKQYACYELTLIILLFLKPAGILCWLDGHLSKRIRLRKRTNVSNDAITDYHQLWSLQQLHSFIVCCSLTRKNGQQSEKFLIRNFLMVFILLSIFEVYYYGRWKIWRKLSSIDLSG